MEIRHGIEKATEKVVENIKLNSKEISGKEEIAQVATVSAGDEKIGNLISEVMDEIGKDGVITVEESNTLGLEKEVVEGMQFDNGFISQYMITDTASMKSVLENPYILLTDKKISSISEVLPVLEQIAQSGKKDIVIIAEDVDGEALTTLVLNKLRGTINVLAVKAPGFGDSRKEMLEDIAVLTGGQVVSSDKGEKLEETKVEMLGTAKRVEADKENTTIIEGAGKKEQIKKRIEQIKKQIGTTKSDYDREKLEKRMGKMSRGVGVIKVGAATEVEMKEIKYKVEDAVEATKAAIAEGIVAGGGVALVDTISELKNIEVKGDEAIGVEIVRKSLEAPMRQIAENAGVEGSIVIENVKKMKAGEGFNALTGEYGDMVKMGIIDPAKVTRSAIQNAASISALILTTEAVVAEKPKEESAGAAMPMGGGNPYAGMM